MLVYVVYGSRLDSTVCIARSIASSVTWSNSYEARHATEVDPSEIHGPGVVFLGYPSGGSELDKGIRHLLDHVAERSMYNVLWAVFDTRTQPQPVVAGSTVRRLRRAIEHRGGKLLVAPESFYVGPCDGHVTNDEVDRARIWASSAIAVAVKMFRDTNVRSGFVSPCSTRPMWETLRLVPT